MSRRQDTVRIRWAEVAAVTVCRPTCPHCGSEDRKHVGTQRNGDQSTTALEICRACGQPYKIIREIPASGNLDEAEE